MRNGFLRPKTRGTGIFEHYLATTQQRLRCSHRLAKGLLLRRNTVSDKNGEVADLRHLVFTVKSLVRLPRARVELYLGPVSLFSMI